MKTTTEQIEKATENAKKIISMGCKLPIEKIIEMELKKIAKSTWHSMTKKDIEKMESRERSENLELPKGFDLAEKMRENAIKNLPSSMR